MSHAPVTRAANASGQVAFRVWLADDRRIRSLTTVLEPGSTALALVN